MADPKAKVSEYLRRAAGHEKHAANTPDPKLKANLLRLAKQYRIQAAQLQLMNRLGMN